MADYLANGVESSYQSFKLKEEAINEPTLPASARSGDGPSHFIPLF
jgi:hypothetical protein